jgi:hypothetical protein
MLEFDVTPLFADKLDAYMLSNSVANLGDNAGQITWENALEAATEYPLATDDNRDEVIDWLKDFGAWSEGDLMQWNNQSLSALLWQFAAADFRDHWADYISDFNETDFDSLEEYDWGSIRIEESSIFPHEGRFYFQASN